MPSCFMWLSTVLLEAPVCTNLQCESNTLFEPTHGDAEQRATFRAPCVPGSSTTYGRESTSSTSHRPSLGRCKLVLTVSYLQVWQGPIRLLQQYRDGMIK